MHGLLQFLLIIKNSMRGALGLYVAGMVIGLVMAVFSLTVQEASALKESESIASVNGVFISNRKFQQNLDILQKDKRNKLDENDRQFVLNKLIEEELLVQHGQTMGLFQSHQAVRTSVIDVIKASFVGADLEAIDDDELHAFYQANIEIFNRPGKLKLKRWTLIENEVELVKNTLWVNDSPANNFQLTLGREPDSLIPGVFMPIRSVARAVGPAGLQQLRLMVINEHSVLTVAGHTYLYQLLGRSSSVTLPLSDVKAVVLKALIKSKRENSFRLFIEGLHRQADISMTSEGI